MKTEIEKRPLRKTGFGTWKLVRKQRTWGNGLKWDVRHPAQAEWFVANNPFDG